MYHVDKGDQALGHMDGTVRSNTVRNSKLAVTIIPPSERISPEIQTEKKERFKPVSSCKRLEVAGWDGKRRW
jgi:hypothetical protein